MKRLRLGVGVWLGVVFGSSAVLAQPSTHAAAAEELFRAGRNLIAQHHYKEACEKLDTSEKLDPAVGTLLSLGECYAGQGRTASAWLAYRSAVALAAAHADPRSAAAEERAIAIEPQVSRVLLRFTDDPALENARVTIAGEAFARDVLGAPIPVDPGEVKIVIAAPGFRAWAASVEVRATGETVERSIPMLERLPDPSVVARERASLALRRKVGFGVGVTGLVTLSVGAILGLQGIVKIRDANAACPGQDACSNAGAVSENQTGRSFADASTVVLPVGAALLAGGALLYVTSRAPGAPEIGADVSSSSARLRVGWSW